MEEYVFDPGLLKKFQHFRAMASRRTAAELGRIAHQKRFIERFIGDSEFRSLHETDLKNECERLGIQVDLATIEPFWKNGVTFTVTDEQVESFPETRLWRDWVKELLEIRSILLEAGQDAPSAGFSSWRKRQIARCKGELGDIDISIIHSVGALELSDGCSVGCWFCGLKAKKLSAVFDYTPENKALWHEVLQTLYGFFGTSLATAFCYWATEPTDNPHYVEFIKDFENVAGVLPQTTCSKPVRDPAWTKDLVQQYKEKACVPCRFSILSVDELRSVHEVFSPEDLLFVELIHQHETNIVQKTAVGRASKNILQKKGQASSSTKHDLGTIACVTGILINMPMKTIQLVTPCRTSARWPLGFQVYDKATFSSGRDIRGFLDHCERTHFKAGLTDFDRCTLRQDLCIETTKNELIVSSTFKRQTFRGAIYACLGDFFTQHKSFTGQELSHHLMQYSNDIFEVIAVTQQLFEQGFFEDTNSGLAL